MNRSSLCKGSRGPGAFQAVTSSSEATDTTKKYRVWLLQPKMLLGLQEHVDPELNFKVVLTGGRRGREQKKGEWRTR